MASVIDWIKAISWSTGAAIEQVSIAFILCVDYLEGVDGRMRKITHLGLWSKC